MLKGNIALAATCFPHGVAGPHLDAVARRALWEVGLDYDHGTGHGVGSYLSVHEGPVSLSRAARTVPIEAGMILSNEPGFYAPGEYGIRLETLLLVQPAGFAGATKPFLGFEVLTLAPFDRRLIAPALLTAAELAWLNAYHARRGAGGSGRGWERPVGYGLRMRARRSGPIPERLHQATAALSLTRRVRDVNPISISSGTLSRDEPGGAVMLGGIELRALSTWCGRHDMSWSPAESDQGPPTMMLKPRDAGRPWQRMMLVLAEGELRLENELGETLASASDLPALLDAVEGGVADAPAAGPHLLGRRTGRVSSLGGFVL